MQSSHFSGRRRALLGLFVSVVAFAGLSNIISEIALLIGRVALIGQDNYTGQSWTETTHVAGTIGWYVLEGAVALAAAAAAYAGSWLSPRRSKIFGICAVALALAVSIFEQFPQPRSNTILAIWALAPAVGALVGTSLQWLSSRGEA